MFSERYYKAKRYFDCRELQKCAYTLEDSEDIQERWLWLYSSFLVCRANAQSEYTHVKTDAYHYVTGRSIQDFRSV